MLYKNDELYKLTMAEHNAIKKRFHKFPVRLVYPESRVKESRSKHNTLPDKPTSTSFPLNASVRTNTGVDAWRYAENKIIGTNGQVKFTPSTFYFRGSMQLQKSDSELLYWLWKCCPYLEGGENWNGKLPKCAVEDLIGTAEKKAMVEEKLSTVKAMIYSSEVGLGEKRLRQVAKAYFIPGIDELSFAQVKLAMEKEVHRNKLTGVDDFLKMVGHEQTLTIRSSIQQAVDSSVLKFDVQTKSWVWITPKGEKDEIIVKVSAVAHPNEALYDYYLGNRVFAENLMASLKGSKVVIPAPMGADEPDGVRGPE